MKSGAVLPAAMVLLGIGMTFLASYLLSKTLLRGVSSHFMLELPPFRRPQILRVILRLSLIHIAGKRSWRPRP